jgi:hypothetical protein
VLAAPNSGAGGSTRGREEPRGKVLRLSDIANNKVRVTTSAKKKKTKKNATSEATKAETDEVDTEGDMLEDVVIDPDDDGVMLQSGEAVAQVSEEAREGDDRQSLAHTRLIYVHP